MGVMTWGQIRLQIQQTTPGVSFDLIDGWLNTRYARILDHIEWSWLKGNGYITTIAPYYSTADKVAVTDGSASIVGTGTTWTSALTGLKFQLSCGGPLYTFTYVSATTATLDRAYAGPTSASTDYRLSQNVYAAPADAKSIRTLVSPDGYDLTALSDYALAEAAPLREILGSSLVYDPRPNSTEDGWDVELYPIPVCAQALPVTYDVIADAFDGTNTGDGPLSFVNDGVVLDGAKADAHAHAGNLPMATYFETKFEADLAAMVRTEALKKPPAKMQMADRFTRHRLRRVTR